MKINIEDTTFLIFVRIDSIARLENVLAVIDYLLSNFNTIIHVTECNSFNNQILKRLLPPEIIYSFIKDDDPVLHRTKYLNEMVRSVDSKYLSIWDADIIAQVNQIVRSVEVLRNKMADFVYPFKNEMLDTTKILRDIFIETRNIDSLIRHKKKMIQMHPPISVGGAFFCERIAYHKVGLENELFYGWGFEDAERYHRWKNSGFKMLRVDGVLFHLTHPRGKNSIMVNQDDFDIKNIIKENSIRTIRIANYNRIYK